MADEENRNAVGAIDQDRIHKEGIEYIKEQVSNNQQNDDPGKGTTSGPESVTLPQPPASNAGADDASAGIAKNAGGVSSTAHVESPVLNADTTTTTIVDTVKNFLGLGQSEPEEKKAEDTEARNAGIATGIGATTAAPSAIAAAAPTSSSPANSSQSFTAELADRTRAATTTAQSSEPASLQEDKTVKDSTEQNKRTMADTGAAAAHVDSSTEKQESIDNTTSSSADREEPQSHKPPKSAGEDGGVAKGKGSLENRDAIPTAGGQRLGDEHWGESKIVPDVPKPVSSSEGPGVASAGGQPNDETASNTAKNTGGASGGPQGSGEKQSVIDKVKDKLKIGNKDKE